MNYQDLLLAHGAFYTYENRAEYYDNYLSKKDKQLWSQSELPYDKIEKLFAFITRWDHHFSGDKVLFKKTYRKLFPLFMELEKYSFIDIDLSDNKIRNYITQIFDGIAQCNRRDRYESTDASKIIHTINPELFIMWDRRIRNGILGDPKPKPGNIYVGDFLTEMKQELRDLLDTCTSNSSYNKNEAIEALKTVCGGKTIPKLIDEYNYMTYTMPTEFQTYKSNLRDELKETLYNNQFDKELETWKTLIHSNPYTSKIKFSEFIKLLNKAKSKGIISAKEWREYSRKWREIPEDRNYLQNLIQNKIS